MSLDDAVTVGAIIAPGIAEEGRAENWFRLISECYHDAVDDNGGSPPDWSGYWSSLSGKATDLTSAERDAFEAYMRSVMTPMEVVVDLAGDSRGAVVSAVLTKYRENQPVAQAAEEPFDEAMWGAYLTKWAGGWDGTEPTWADFAQGMRYWAGEEPAGATELTRRVEELLSHAESQDIPARTEFLAAYGIVTAAAEEPFDESLWGAYLTKWAGGWDGTEPTWADFAQGMRYWASEEPAGATELTRRVEELLSHAESQDIPARTEFLAAYGIVTAAGGGADDHAQVIQTLTETGATETIVQTLLEETIVPGLAEAIAEVPGAAELTAEEIQQILVEVLEEQFTADDASA
ncbi:hypothetical protein SAMN05216553_101737 [Lentzea fradiae]|uniref:Uncharacterized protein n=1 Tax=Lentzea fradiae TaxID=200378 RepID=A0A1G7LAB8_9PSEU|nr:hypothetical protein [Lentzea fradiae]SDF45970.1 hypothetical protein SAMN05216553_101737 [Lentzea fradiae]